MNRLAVLLSLSLLATSGSIAAPPNPGDGQETKIPGKWLKKAKGYEKALEIQKETGADIFLYVARMVPSDQKGLCRWWEKQGMGTGEVRKLLKNYIKVQITLPSNSDDEDIATKFKVKSCPSVTIIQPNGWNGYVKVFDWPGGKPKLKTQDELVELILSKSSKPEQAAE